MTTEFWSRIYSAFILCWVMGWIFLFRPDGFVSYAIYSAMLVVWQPRLTEAWYVLRHGSPSAVCLTCGK